MDNSRMIEELLKERSNIGNRMIIICSKEHGESLLKLAKDAGIIIDTVESEPVGDMIERQLRHESDRLAEEIERQRAAFSEEVEKSMVEEKYKDPAEVENRAYMKEQQRLARRYQSRFRKK